MSWDPHDWLVLELANVLAGPSVGACFAELGSTVVKIENPRTRGDVTRSWKLPTESDASDLSAYFCAVNWGKQSAAIDLSTPAGRDLTHRLAARADVVIASYKPGDAKKLGVDYDTLAQLNPRVVVGEISGYGPESPRVGYDAIIQAEAGYTGINGHDAVDAHKMPVALMDVLAGLQLKVGLLVALLRRAHTGRGQRVTVSLLQAGVAGLVNQATNYLMAGHVATPLGNEHPTIVPYGTRLMTADGSVVLAVGTDRQFADLCAMLGCAVEPQFATNPQRVRHRAAVNTMLASRVRQWKTADFVAACAAKHIPAGEVNRINEVFKQPAAADLVLRGVSNHGQAVAGVVSNVFASAADVRAHLSPPPHLGEHTDLVLSRWLGADPTMLAEWRTQGVIL